MHNGAYDWECIGGWGLGSGMESFNLLVVGRGCTKKVLRAMGKMREFGKSEHAGLGRYDGGIDKSSRHI